MSKKKQKKDNKTKATTNGSTAHALRPLWLFAVFSFLLVLACAAVINLLHAQQVNRQHLATSSQQLADTYAAGLARRLAPAGS